MLTRAQRERNLQTLYATRDPDDFAANLAIWAKLPLVRVQHEVAYTRATHEESHRALECLSELAMRAMVLRRLSTMCSEAQYNALHVELCTFNASTRARLVRAMRQIGLRNVFWEDVVLAGLTRN